MSIVKIKRRIAKSEGKLKKVHAKYVKAKKRHRPLKRHYFKLRSQQIKAWIAHLKRALAKAEARAAVRVMYDSVSVHGIPSGAKAVAGYKDGRYRNIGAMIARFPRARHVSIAVFASTNADCLDIESGDAVPSQAPGWVKRQRALGKKRPIVYSSQSEMPQVLTALDRAGLRRKDVRVWSAHYGRKHICSPAACGAKFTADATQWRNTATFDESLCKPSFW